MLSLLFIQVCLVYIAGAGHLPYFETSEPSDAIITYICEKIVQNCQFQHINPFKPPSHQHPIVSTLLILTEIYVYIRLIFLVNKDIKNHSKQIEVQCIDKLQRGIYKLFTGRNSPRGYYSEMFNVELRNRQFTLYLIFAILNVLKLLIAAQPFLAASKHFNKYIEEVQGFKINFIIFKVINFLNASYNNIFPLISAGIFALQALPILSELFDQKDDFFTYFDKEYVKVFDMLRFQAYKYKIPGAELKSQKAIQFFEKDKDLSSYVSKMQEEIKFYLVNGRLIPSSAFPNFHNLGFKFGDILQDKKVLIREQRHIDELLKQEKQEIPLELMLQLLDNCEKPSIKKLPRKLKMRSLGQI